MLQFIYSNILLRILQSSKWDISILQDKLFLTSNSYLKTKKNNLLEKGVALHPLAEKIYVPEKLWYLIGGGKNGEKWPIF